VCHHRGHDHDHDHDLHHNHHPDETTSGMSYQLLSQTLIESFNALADEVQALTDRKTILEHKLRYAHEQVGSWICFFFFFCGIFLCDDPL
jgi:hypothetical protein